MRDIGTLYVLSNIDGSLAKVGLTRNGSPDARATDYERAHGICWHVYWSAATCHVGTAEAAAHRELDIRRFALVPGARQIFHVTPAKAKRVAARCVVPPNGAARQPDARAVRAAWLDYGAVLVLAASAEFVGALAARIRRHRYGRQIFASRSVLTRVLSWWLVSRQRQTFK